MRAEWWKGRRAEVIPSERVARVEGSWYRATDGDPSTRDHRSLAGDDWRRTFRLSAFPPLPRPKGATLIELLVVLVILGIIAGTTGAALRQRPRGTGASAQSLERQRRLAIRSGQAVTTRDSLGRTIRFLPDGRATGPGIDPLTGRPRGAR